MKDITDSLTTRFEQDFPYYLPKIAEVISKSKKRLLILGVVPTHGAYTDCKSWLNIQDAIEDKVREQQKVQRNPKAKPFIAQMVCGNVDTRSSSYEVVYKRFKDSESDWMDWKHNNHKQLIGFLELALDGQKITAIDLGSLSVQDLIEVRLQHERIIDDLYDKPFQVNLANDVFPFFCWIADDEAVFAFKTEDAEGSYNGSGIFTRDPKLIETLERTFYYYQAKAAPRISKT